jgi:putative membrane protein
MSIGFARTLVLTALLVAPAAAHGPVLVQPDTRSVPWNIDPWVLIPLVMALWLYGRGVRRLWVRAGWGRGVSGANVISFAAGQAVLVGALVSPLDPLGGALLSAHMAQHGLLVGLAPPLLLLGKPGVAFAWALPGAWMKGHFAPIVWRSLSALGRALSEPLRAAALHGVMLWLWHAPVLFEAAVEHDGWHALQHACFFGSVLLFWRAVLDARTGRRAGPALVAAFVTFMHSGMLGGLITMAPQPLYPVYAGRGATWGLTALDDQQLAGLLMWVPLGLPYLAAGLCLAWRLVSGQHDDATTRRTSTLSSSAP